MDASFQTVLTVNDKDCDVVIGYDIIDRHYGRPAFPEVISVTKNGVEIIEEIDCHEMECAEQEAISHLSNSEYESPNKFRFNSIDDLADDAYEAWRQNRVDGY